MEERQRLSGAADSVRKISRPEGDTYMTAGNTNRRVEDAYADVLYQRTQPPQSMAEILSPFFGDFHAQQHDRRHRAWL